jgi:hypothetical protein
MTELPDTWNEIDLPVLREAVRICDEDLVDGGARLGEMPRPPAPAKTTPFVRCGAWHQTA